MLSSSPICNYNTVVYMSTISGSWTTSAGFVDVQPLDTSGASRPKKKVYRPVKIYKDGPYVSEPALAKDPNVFQFIAKAIGDWFDGKSKKKNAVKGMEGIMAEAPWKEESLTTPKQSRAPGSGLSPKGY